MILILDLIAQYHLRSRVHLRREEKRSERKEKNMLCSKVFLRREVRGKKKVVFQRFIFKRIERKIKEMDGSLGLNFILPNWK